MMQSILSESADAAAQRITETKVGPSRHRQSKLSMPLDADAGGFAHGGSLPEPYVPPSPGAAVLNEFDALYHKYERRVFRQCYRMTGNQEDAEDLAQEVFLQVFRKAHTFRGESSFSTWLHRMTINTVLMHIRRNRRWRGAMVSVDAAPAPDEGAANLSPVVNALSVPPANSLDRISVAVALAHLSLGYQEIFVLHDVEGYRHDEIAGLLGISEGTSKSQLHKARLRLRALMGSDDGRSAALDSAPPARNRGKKHCPSPFGPEYALA